MTGDPTVLKKASSLEEWAYRQIRELIMAGEMKPGQQIVQEDLAVRLGVSRTPLRRALTQLERDNLVEVRPHTGAFVREFTIDEIIGIFEVRAVLEGLVCRLVTPRIEARHLAYLRALMAQAREEATKGNEAYYRQADREFHQYFVDLVEYEVVQNLLPSYQILDLSFVQGLLRPPEETLPEHYAIMDAFETRDPDRTEEAARIHVRRTITYLKERAKEQR